MPTKPYPLLTMNPNHVCKKRAGWRMISKELGTCYWCALCGSLWIEDKEGNGRWASPSILIQHASDTLVMKRAAEVSQNPQHTGGPYKRV